MVVVVVGMIVAETRNGCYFVPQCIVVIVAQSVAVQTVDHVDHLIGLQMALVIFGKNSLAAAAVPVAVDVIHWKLEHFTTGYPIVI